MKLLLDTHTALWWVNEHERLSLTAKDMLLCNDSTLYISIASIWEIAIKVSIGKMQVLSGGVGTFITKLKQMPVFLLPIVPKHIGIVETLPFIHRDPFDRLLVATAKAEGMTIVTIDENIHKYDAPCAW